MNCEQPYPALYINLQYLRENAIKIVDTCTKAGIRVTGVVKGCDSFEKSYNEIADILMESGCESIGDSRIQSIQCMRENGFTSDIMLLRVPMKSEIPDVVQHVDISLQSEMEILQLTNKEAGKIGKKHGVLLMMDLGDLREGFFEEYELVKAAKFVENECEHLELKGVGTNLGCYGSVTPDENNLGRLVYIAHKVEKEIGRKLDYVSGGASTSFPLVYHGEIMEGINHLRIGEAFLRPTYLTDDLGCEDFDIHKHIYTLQAEIIELKNKPSRPIGRLSRDAFGHARRYEDRGIRMRALLAVGKRDLGSFEYIKARTYGAQVLGGSSDHLIVDVEDVEEELKIGDVLEFDITYGALIFTTLSNFVRKHYIR